MASAVTPAPEIQTGPRGRRWLPRLLAGGFAVLLLYPFSGLFAHEGGWIWNGAARADALASIRVSLLLTAVALAVVVALGTPMALYIRRAGRREQIWWQAALLASMLLPALALGILLTLALRPQGVVGGLLWHLGLATSNSGFAFVLTQAYVCAGYYILGAVAAFEAMPAGLEEQAALLGLKPAAVFWRVTLPVARRGLLVALSLAWARAIGEFGAVVVTAYYPAGIPVQLWINLQSRGLPAVLPLLLVFLFVALPLPLVAYVAGRPKGAGLRSVAPSDPGARPKHA